MHNRTTSITTIDNSQKPSKMSDTTTNPQSSEDSNNSDLCTAHPDIDPQQIALLKRIFDYRDEFAQGYIETTLIPTLHVPEVMRPISIGGPVEENLIEFIGIKDLYTGPEGAVGMVFLCIEPKEPGSKDRQEAFFFLRDSADRLAMNPAGQEWTESKVSDSVFWGVECNFWV